MHLMRTKLAETQKYEDQQTHCGDFLNQRLRIPNISRCPLIYWRILSDFLASETIAELFLHNIVEPFFCLDPEWRGKLTLYQLGSQVIWLAQPKTPPEKVNDQKKHLQDPADAI